MERRSYGTLPLAALVQRAAADAAQQAGAADDDDWGDFDITEASASVTPPAAAATADTLQAAATSAVPADALLAVASDASFLAVALARHVWMLEAPFSAAEVTEVDQDDDVTALACVAGLGVLVGLANGALRVFTARGGGKVFCHVHASPLVSFKVRRDQVAMLHADRVLVVAEAMREPLRYTKLRFDTRGAVADAVACGPVAQAGAAHAHTMYVSVGRAPMLASYTAASEASSYTAALSLARGLTSAVVSLATTWWKPAPDAVPPQQQKAMEEKPALLPQDIALHDSRRAITSISLDPSGALGVMSDTFGRVMLLSVQDMLVLRMWKGYRDAQSAWLHRASQLYLVLYLPRRGLLELWPMRFGPLHARLNVGCNHRLLATVPVAVPEQQDLPRLSSLSSSSLQHRQTEQQTSSAAGTSPGTGKKQRGAAVPLFARCYLVTAECEMHELVVVDAVTAEDTQRNQAELEAQAAAAEEARRRARAQALAQQQLARPELLRFQRASSASERLAVLQDTQSPTDLLLCLNAMTDDDMTAEEHAQAVAAALEHVNAQLRDQDSLSVDTEASQTLPAFLRRERLVRAFQLLTSISAGTTGLSCSRFIECFNPGVPDDDSVQLLPYLRPRDIESVSIVLFHPLLSSAADAPRVFADALELLELTSHDLQLAFKHWFFAQPVRQLRDVALAQPQPPIWQQWLRRLVMQSISEPEALGILAEAVRTSSQVHHAAGLAHLLAVEICTLPDGAPARARVLTHWRELDDALARHAILFEHVTAVPDLAVFPSLDQVTGVSLPRVFALQALHGALSDTLKDAYPQETQPDLLHAHAVDAVISRDPEPTTALPLLLLHLDSITSPHLRAGMVLRALSSPHALGHVDALWSCLAQRTRGRCPDPRLLAAAVPGLPDAAAAATLLDDVLVAVAMLRDAVAAAAAASHVHPVLPENVSSPYAELQAMVASNASIDLAPLRSLERVCHVMLVILRHGLKRSCKLAGLFAGSDTVMQEIDAHLPLLLTPSQRKEASAAAACESGGSRGSEGRADAGGSSCGSSRGSAGSAKHRRRSGSDTRIVSATRVCTSPPDGSVSGPGFLTPQLKLCLGVLELGHRDVAAALAHQLDLDFDLVQREFVTRHYYAGRDAAAEEQMRLVNDKGRLARMLLPIARYRLGVFLDALPRGRRGVALAAVAGDVLRWILDAVRQSDRPAPPQPPSLLATHALLVHVLHMMPRESSQHAPARQLLDAAIAVREALADF